MTCQNECGSSYGIVRLGDDALLIPSLLVHTTPRLESNGNNPTYAKMPIDRSGARNVHFYDATSPGVALGGMIQNGSVTEANFLSMLSILLISEDPLHVQERGSGHIVAATNNALQTGDYDVYCNSSIKVNDEPWVHRIITRSVSGREDSFRRGVRERDGRCVLTGVVNRRAPFDTWVGYEAAHIFPLDSESWWVDHDYGRWIRDVTPGVSKINSRQNGFLLQSTVHQEFDNYLVSVNPDDNYKIIVFGIDVWGVDGRTLDPVCRNPTDPHRVCDQLLRWHLRQSVLANMRAAGEPIFEHDFPSGTDMIAEISAEPYAKERLEMEFSNRLRGIS